MLNSCLESGAWPDDLLDRAIAEDEGRAILSIVVERLGDLFEPRLCDVYERLFTQVIERVEPSLKPRLRQRSAISKTPKPPAATDCVYVLSRVTLGADVAVTSVLIDAAKRKYPDARIIFMGPDKAFQMFEADTRVQAGPTPYVRGGPLLERLHCSRNLWIGDGIVIDPDSRLSQLGLIAVCDESRYFFFESRSYGGDGKDRLPDLAARWAHEVFGVEARPYIAPRILPQGDAADITVSLGVGENESKRVNDEFERELIRALAGTGMDVLIDMGGSAEERKRVERAAGSLWPVRTHEGSFASFAAAIARSKLFVGYDSAGGHVASACGIPSISIFTGAVSDRFFARWRTSGTVIRGDGRDAREILERATAAIKSYL